MRLFAALLVVLLVGSAIGVGASHSPADRVDDQMRLSPSSGATVVTDTTDAANVTTSTGSNATVRENTVMHITLRENGDARWNVTARYHLADNNETEAFRQLASEYEDGRSQSGLTTPTFERVVERVNAESNRSMELREVGRSAAIRNDGSVGVLTLSFTWTNFTQLTDNKIVLGDVFWVGSDTWLPTLSEDQTLVITVPSDYYILGASPSGGQIVNGTVLRYEGPQEFTRGDFEVTYSPKSIGTPTPSEGFFPGGSSLFGLVAVFVLLTGSFGAYALAQRRDVDPTPATGSSSGSGDDSPASATETQTSDGVEGDSADADDGDSDEPAPELLSDEERVLRLLRDNDGRMKQGQIVKETNWSNAKVSQLLSKMDDNDEVDKLRIGRENLITLPDEDVTEMS
ncbi:helix-turn-helix transcriptional regulator [Halorussus pelagicus]|uniref:helix-turn-helix transcriptional regulator n=1 Tax=Halorussus pelagicus TaxID=2505977 RepID=UPI000FFB1347|nr:hypothetical protein [Halorussus pelagicus]